MCSLAMDGMKDYAILHFNIIMIIYSNIYYSRKGGGGGGVGFFYNTMSNLSKRPTQLYIDLGTQGKYLIADLESIDQLYIQHLYNSCLTLEMSMITCVVKIHLVGFKSFLNTCNSVMQSGFI